MTKSKTAKGGKPSRRAASAGLSRKRRARPARPKGRPRPPAKPPSPEAAPPGPHPTEAAEALAATPSRAVTPPARPSAIVHGPGLQVRPGQHLLYVNRADLERLPWEAGEVLKHVQMALRELGRGKAEKPPQISLYPQRESLLSATAAFLPNLQACGLEWLGSFPNNHRLNLPQVSALLVLSDPHSGFPLAVMDATWLAAQRGPAVSAIAARLLARPNSTRAAIIGGGVQGRGHVAALADALPDLQQIRIFDVRHGQAVKAAKGWRGQIRAALRIDPVEAVEHAVRGADVIVSATAISDEPSPTVSADWIRTGALVLSLDLDAVFEPEFFERADRLYVDSLADLEALRDRGFFRNGLPAHIAGQLGELVAGKITGRGADAERIVCLSVGAGGVDVALARAIYDKACRLGIGQLLEL